MKTVVFLLVLAGTFTAVLAAEDGRKIVFDEARIEGKIRRPQLVLIQAEQRPTFNPMVMQSLRGMTNIVEFVSDSVIESGSYSGAFEFDGTSITNYVP